MALQTYNLENLLVTIGGVPITEFAAGDSMTHSFKDDDWTFVQGSHGSAVRSRKFNHVSDLTIKVLQGSNTNSTLEGLAQVSTMFVPIPVVIFDIGSMQPVLECFQATFVKDPELALGEEAGTREWKLTLVNAITHHGPLGLLGDIVGLLSP